MGCHGIKPDAEMFHTFGCIVRFQNRISDRPFSGLFRTYLFPRHLFNLCGLRFGNDLLPVYKIHTAVIQLYHLCSSCLLFCLFLCLVLNAFLTLLFNASF